MGNGEDLRDSTKRSVAELVYATIANRIVSGEFGADERLTEAQLVKDLKVSRGAVREAMSKLAADGLIEIELNKGAVVRSISRKNMADFLQVLALYEGFASRRSAERIDEPGTREAIRDVIAQCDALLENPTVDGMVATDTSFHTAIMELSGNELMAAEWRRLRRSRYRVAFLRSLSRDDIIATVERDRETLFAILDGDAGIAHDLASRNVRLVNNQIQRLSNEQFDAIFNPPGMKAAKDPLPNKGRAKSKVGEKPVRTSQKTKVAAA